MDFFRRLIANLAEFWDRVQPDFWRRLKPSYRWALGILIFVALWIASGVLSFHSKPAANAQAAEMPHVRVAVLTASDRDASLTIRGRTAALHSVNLEAEVDGVVQAIHFEKGDRVKAGQVLCELKLKDRAAKLAQAHALVVQTQKQHAVDLDLAKDGFRSTTQVDQSAASLEAARASEQTMAIDLENTKIKAPFDGLIDDRYVDVGDYMRVGDKCALLIAPEPFLAVGQVSEREVSEIKVGNPASAVLVTGETVQGHIRFVASRADDTTRTFRVEVELPNPDGKLRVGVSADIHIPVRQLMAQKISPGILVLDDNGIVGVRAVEQGTVHFFPVNIVSDGPDGMWVSGLPDHLAVITVGQSFVTDGERVKAVLTGGRG
ncbi:MAG TPA: efflux RND transporter periplasmic adaptor subunit [Rhizomicrobium sp.]|nr:efflux RND transporter periplasmic adaptor subunit [Rhizomicrobium sp.]